MRVDEKYAAEFARHPGQVAVIRFDGIEAGVFTRRHVRAALNRARIRGAEVEAREARGLLGSTFAVRMRGTRDQLMPCLTALAEWED